MISFTLPMSHALLMSFVIYLSIPCIRPVNVVDVMLIRASSAPSTGLTVFPKRICEPKEGQSNRNGGEAQEDEESIRV